MLCEKQPARASAKLLEQWKWDVEDIYGSYVQRRNQPRRAYLTTFGTSRVKA